MSVFVGKFVHESLHTVIFACCSAFIAFSHLSSTLHKVIYNINSPILARTSLWSLSLYYLVSISVLHHYCCQLLCFWKSWRLLVCLLVYYSLQIRIVCYSNGSDLLKGNTCRHYFWRLFLLVCHALHFIVILNINSQPLWQDRLLYQSISSMLLIRCC